MIPTPRSAWARAAILTAAAYLVIGRVFASPALNVRPWRLAAWLLSGGVFVAHLWYEQSRLRHGSRSAALHVAAAVALGAFALAAVGMMLSTVDPSEVRPKWLLALVLWPAVTAIPAYLATLAAGLILAHLSTPKNKAP